MHFPNLQFKILVDKGIVLNHGSKPNIFTNPEKKKIENIRKGKNKNMQFFVDDFMLCYLFMHLFIYCAFGLTEC